ncbi:hypothetical protein IG631_06090 [Alternaria alternata]|nr:hypothetical protein IG631_06090 [Alternaria alternata]
MTVGKAPRGISQAVTREQRHQLSDYSEQILCVDPRRHTLTLHFRKKARYTGMCRYSNRVHNHAEIPSGWKACSASNRKSRRQDFGLFKLRTNVRSVSGAWPCPLYPTLPRHPRFVEIEKLPLAVVPCGH